MLYSTTVSTTNELQQILFLQKQNLKTAVSEKEKREQGFVTMTFTLEMLEAMHKLAPSVIVKNEDQVVGYAIVFLREGRKVYPAMEPMFLNFEKIKWKGKAFNTYRFYIIGQICIAKAYRGMGVFDMLYDKHKEIYQSSFDCVVTEISESNYRSMRAHERIGFKTISRHRDEIDGWNVVLWDWDKE